MAVLVQEQVAPQVSFVLHTASALGGDSGTLTAEVAAGLGETLASGTRGSPWRFSVDKQTGFACCVAGVPGQTCADKVLNSEQQTAQGTFPGASRCRSWHSSVCHVSGIVVAMLPCCVPRQRGCDVKDVAAGVERSLPPTAKGLDCRQGSLGECSQPQQGRCIWYAWYCNKHVQPGCCIIWCREQESR